MSDLEELLAFQLKAAGIKYEREYRFHSVRKWRFDFVLQQSRIGIEIDGGIWNRGRHARGAGIESGMDKGNAAVLLGWRYFRFSGKHIKSGEALKTIEAALK